MNTQKRLVKKQLDKIREQSRRKETTNQLIPKLLFILGIIMMLLFIDEWIKIDVTYFFFLYYLFFL